MPAAGGRSPDQRIGRAHHEALDAGELELVFPGRLPVGERLEVVERQHRPEPLHAGHSLLRERQVRDQPPVEIAPHRRRHRRRHVGDVPEFRELGGTGRGHRHVPDAQAPGQATVGAGEPERHGLGVGKRRIARRRVEREPRLGSIADHGRLHAKKVVDAPGIPQSRALDEVEEGGILARIGRAGLETPHPVDREDLVVRRILPRGAHQVLGLVMLDADRVGVLLEQVDRRRAAEDEVVGGQPKRADRRPVEPQHDVELVLAAHLGQATEARDLDEVELLGKGEIFLEQPEAGPRIGGPREHRLRFVEAAHPHGAGRERRRRQDTSARHGTDLRVARVLREEQVQAAGHIGLAVQEEAELVDVQLRARGRPRSLPPGRVTPRWWSGSGRACRPPASNRPRCRAARHAAPSWRRAPA
ncbi:MAG: hypothetical protein FD129_2138 [bacterium]|nr:MAG: hypothetical protein FD129_2138 [bacterium]